MSSAVLLAFLSVAPFTDRPVTDKVAVPAPAQTNEYVLSFKATFPKGAPRSLKLYQYFPHAHNPRGENEMHTTIDFTGITRTLGAVVNGSFTGVPWFNRSYVDAPIPDGATRRVAIVCHRQAVSYWVEFGDKFYRTHVDRVVPHYRLTSLRFDELGAAGAAVRVSDVKVSPLTAERLSVPRAGYRIAESPETFVVPVEGEETHFSFLPGGYPVKIALRFVDGTTNAPAYTLSSFAQRVTPLCEDSGLTLETGPRDANRLMIYTRPRLSERYRAEQIAAMMTNGVSYGECAAKHAFDIRLLKRGNDYQLWIDGDFARLIPAHTVQRIELDVPPAAQIKVLPAQKKLFLSPLAEPLPDRAPFPVAKCRENLGAYSLTHDAYRSRRPFECLPDNYLRRVPLGTYTQARVRCRLAGDLKKDTRLTARLTNFALNGERDGASSDAMTEETKTIERLPDQDVYEVTFNLDPAQIQDVIWQRGMTALHFEVLGGVKKVGYIGTTGHKPDEEHPSDVVVLGAELVHAPAGMWIENGRLGNLFYAKSELPHLTAHVSARLAGDYTLTWKVTDIAGREIESHADSLRLAAGENGDCRFDAQAKEPGWYGVVTTLAAADGTRCVTRRSSFVLLAPDTRKAGYESPYFSWTPWHLWFGRDADYWRDWVEHFRRFGIHHATVSRYDEALFADYPLTTSPLPALEFSTDPSKEKRLAHYEKQVLDFKRRFPHATVATILHENYGGDAPLEIVGGVSTIDAKQKENDVLWTLRASEIASTYRKLWPEMRLSLGNSGESLGVAGELYRGKIDQSLIDFVGEESVGASTIPEVNVAQNFWTLREEARVFGYDSVQPAACYEWKSRPRRLFQFPRVQAATKVRDALIAHAWRSPSITVDTSAEPSTCYFETSWGGGAFTREPLMQPLPDAAAIATLTRVLDSCAFRRLVPTGSKTVYCLEFTRGKEFVYALWTPRGAIDATIVTKARRAIRTDCYGASQDKSRWFSSEIKTEISEEPSYLTLDKPILSFALAKGSRRVGLEHYAGADKAREIVRFDDASAVMPLVGKAAPGGFGPARGQLPIVRDAKFDVATVDDEEKGRVVELTLRTDEPIPSPLVKEVATVALKTPVTIPSDVTTLVLDVKGNSCWGKFTAILEDAKGKRFAFQGNGGECYFDQPGAVANNFDGWYRLYLPLTSDSPVRNASIYMNEQQWRCLNGPFNTPMTQPFKFVGFGATLKRQTLNLIEMEDVATLSVRFASVLGFAAPSALSVDADFPGGNVVVDQIDEAAGEVHLRPDNIHSKGWFYTSFRVRGAEGRTVRFCYEPNRERLSKVGPAISSDGGRTWRFANAAKADAKADEFTYTFGPEEREVRFSIGIPYVASDWRAFVERFRGNPRVRETALCPSQSGLRTNELLRVSGSDDAAAKVAIFFTCRHHACEMSASRVMEGVIEGALAETPEAKWARSNAVLFFVPFMDKDGVEAGEQGKVREPHDHNQDYLAGDFTSVRAVRDLVRRESKGRRFAFVDLHAPWIRENEHDHFYFLLPQNTKLTPAFERFRRAFVEFQKGGSLVYDPKWDIPAGSPWNSSDDYDRKGLMMADVWAGREPNCVNTFCAEIGYGLCGGVYTEEGAREIGRNLFRALVSQLRGGNGLVGCAARPSPRTD